MPKGILNKASLVMVPEAPIDGTMPSVFPEDRSGDFTFTRGSNLAATRVASNGLIEKGRENLFTYSQDFRDAAGWLVSNATKVSITETDPNGGSTAANITWTSGSDRYFYKNITQGNVLTTSFYIKSNGGGNKFRLFGDGANDLSQDFTATNEWQRFEFFFERGSGQGVGITNASDNSAADLIVAFAQVEAGLVATSYIESVATTGKAGLLENEPRIDFTGGGCGSLLLEPQRTNLITQSEYFGSATWGKQNSIGVNTNSHLSPEGIQNATELDGFDSSNFQSVIQYITLSDGTYTFSVFLKKTTGALTHYPAVVMGSVYKYVIVNSTTGTYAEATGTNDNNSVTIESWDDNWWRVSLTNTLSAGAQRFAIYPSLSANGTGITTNASGTNTFFGAQLEAGSYPTSYIPTYGSSVTRSAPSLSKYDLIDSTSQTLFIEYGKTGYTGGGGEIIFEKTNPVAAIFRIYFEVDNSGTDNSRVRFRTEFPATNNDYNLGNKDEYKKIALSIDRDTAKFFGNGVLLGQFSVTSTVLEQLNVRMQSSKYSTKQLILFPTALTDEECSALTQP